MMCLVITEYRGKDGPLVITTPTSAPLGDIFIRAGAELGYKDVDCNGEDQIGNTKDNILGAMKLSTIKQ